MKDNYSIYFFIIVIFIGMFIYINKKMEKNQKAINKKLRFGIVISSIVMALSFAIIPASDLLSNELQRLFKSNDKSITIASVQYLLLLLLLQLLCYLFMFQLIKINI